MSNGVHTVAMGSTLLFQCCLSALVDKEVALEFVAFMLDPENAAIQSNFAGYANGIAGSETHMSEELKSAPEMAAPADVKAVFTQTCSEQAIKLADRVWTKLMQ